MGPRSVRITAEDFVVSVEFGGLRLAEHSAGQIGGVHLTLVESEGRTIFGPIYQQVPLRVLPPFQFPGEPAALVYLLNPTAGLLDGDGHLVEVHAADGAHAVVTGQSATRIHPAVSGFSTQQWQVHAAACSQLVLLPGPNIPFRGCRYHQKAVIDLEDNARLIWGDIWTPGRYARVGTYAEMHEFEFVVQELEVRRNGTLIYRDRFTWNGPWDEFTVRWHLGGHPAIATAGLFVTSSLSLPTLGRESAFHRVVFPLAHGDTLIRWCGPPPAITTDLVKTALTAAAGWSGGESAPPWLIGANHLGQNYWFSA